MADLMPFAHAGHWALWVLYLVPVVIVLFATAQAFLRERRARKHQSSETG
jgi:cytochrome c-type biogenesis protein CcmH/NrfF